MSGKKLHVKLSVVFLLIMITALAALMPVSAITLNTVSVSGNKLMAGGSELILRGVNVLDPLKHFRYIGNFGNDYYAHAAAWGSNVVRIPIHPDEWGNRWFDGTNGRDKYAVINQAVTWAAANGMYSIIDWHVIGSMVTGYFQSTAYKTTQAQTEEFWTYIANTYKNSDCVAAYELWNEPVTGRDGWSVTESQWIAQRDWIEPLVDVIRAIDPVKPIIVGGLDWGYQLEYAGANPVRRSGIVYAAHPYPNQDLPWESYYGYLKTTYPVLVTEFGFDNADTQYRESNYNDKGGTGVYSTEIINYLESKGIGWMPWSFGPEWAPKLVSDWNYTETEQGTFFKNKLLTLNGAPTPAASPTASVSPTSTVTPSGTPGAPSPTPTATASVSPTATPSPSGGGTTLFTDGFESGNFTAGGWTDSGASIGVTVNAKYTGAYSGSCWNNNGWFAKAYNTTGYNTIQVSYARYNNSGSSTDYLYVEWYDGASWNVIEQVPGMYAWTVKTWTLPAGAGNNPNFQIRFRSDAGVPDKSYIDDVRIFVP